MLLLANKQKEGKFFTEICSCTLFSCTINKIKKKKNSLQSQFLVSVNLWLYENFKTRKCYREYHRRHETNLLTSLLSISIAPKLLFNLFLPGFWSRVKVKQHNNIRKRHHDNKVFNKFMPSASQTNHFIFSNPVFFYNMNLKSR